NGTVGTIDNRPPVGTPAVGTVDPGDNASANPVGTLHSQTATWGAGTSFFVDLTHTSGGAPVAGTDNDLLSVTGDIFLNGATLTGLVAPSVQIGDTFTII